MDVRPHLPGGGVEEPGEGGLRDQLAGLVAQDVDPQDVAGVGVGYELHEAVRLIVDERHGVAAEREALRLHAPAALPRLLLREAHRRHVGSAVGHAGGAAVVQGLDVLAGDRLGGEVALGGGDVCELEPADDVAHGEDAGLGRAVAAVHLDAGIFDLHVGVFEAHTVRLAAAADRDQDPLRSHRLLTPGLLDGQLDDAVVDACRLSLHGGAGENGGAAGGEQLLDAASQVAVLEGQESGQRLDHGDLRAHVQVERCELQPYGAAADDGDRLWDVRELEAVVAGQDALAVRLQAGQRLRPGAGGEDDVPRLDAAAADVDLGRRQEAGVALDDLDLVLLDKGAQALVQDADH